MTPRDEQPQRIDDHLDPGPGVQGTAEGAPTDGVEIEPADLDEAVEPDDNAFEVDGPQAGHA